MTALGHMRARCPRSRCGATLVEIMVASVIMITVIGATSYALSSVVSAFGGATSEFSGYQQALTLETMIKSEAARAKTISFSKSAAQPDTTFSSFGFLDDGSAKKVFTIRLKPRDSASTTTVRLSAISEVDLDFVQLEARSRLDYRIVALDNGVPYTLTGGVVLNNIPTVDNSCLLTPATTLGLDQYRWLAFKPETPAP